MATKTYRAEVTREGDWLIIRIPEFDVITRTLHEDEVEEVAREMLATRLGVERSEIHVDVEHAD